MSRLSDYNPESGIVFQTTVQDILEEEKAGGGGSEGEVIANRGDPKNPNFSGPRVNETQSDRDRLARELGYKQGTRAMGSSSGSGSGAKKIPASAVTRKILEDAGANFDVMPGFAVLNGVVYQTEDGEVFSYKGTAPKEVQAAVAESQRQALLADMRADPSRPRTDEHGQIVTLNADGQSTTTRTAPGQARLGTPGTPRPGNGAGRAPRIEVLDEFARDRAGTDFATLASTDFARAKALEQEFYAQDAWTAQDIADAEAIEAFKGEQQRSLNAQAERQGEAEDFYQSRKRRRDEIPAFASGGIYGAGHVPEQQRRVQQTQIEGASAPVEASPFFVNNDPLYGGPPKDDVFTAARFDRALDFARRGDYDPLNPAGFTMQMAGRNQGERRYFNGHWYRMNMGRWELDDIEFLDLNDPNNSHLVYREPMAGVPASKSDSTTFAGEIDVPFYTPPREDDPDMPNGPAPVPERPRLENPMILGGGGQFWTKEPIVGFGAITGKPLFIAGEQDEEFISVLNKGQAKQKGILTPRQERQLAAMNGMAV